MRTVLALLFLILMLFNTNLYADLIIDNFENDRSPANGPGNDAWWNPPGNPTFIPAIETTQVHQGSGALKVAWENKGLFPSFQLANLHINGNAGTLFDEADAVRMYIRGNGGRIIMKLSDANGLTTGDISDVNTTDTGKFEVFEFPFFETVIQRWPDFDLTQTAEMQLLIDAGNLGSSGEIIIDSIELILGSGENAEVVAVLDNFDNDTSIEDDPTEADTLPSSFSVIAEQFATFQFEVVDDPLRADNAVLQIDFNTSPFNVIFISRLDVTDWRGTNSVAIDILGEVGGLLMKLQFDDLTESQDLPPAFQDNPGGQWNTLSWGFDNVEPDRLADMRSLLFFIEGPTGGEGTIFVDNVTLIGDITSLEQWSLY